MFLTKLLVFQMIVCWQYVHTSQYVEVTCLHGCSVGRSTIIAIEGKDVTLKYDVNTKDFIMMQIHYEQNLVLTLQSGGKICVNQYKPDFINVNGTKAESTVHGYYFIFKLMSVGEFMQNTRLSSLMTLDDGEMKRDAKHFTIISAPTTTESPPTTPTTTTPAKPPHYCVAYSTFVFVTTVLSLVIVLLTSVVVYAVCKGGYHHGMSKKGGMYFLQSHM